MNNIYIYNDSFISLLNLIKCLFKNKIRPYNIKNTFYNKNMFDNIIKLNIESDEEIIKEFINIFNTYNFKLIYNVFNSNEENKEIIIYYYLLNYFKYKDKLGMMRNLKCVSETLRISEKIGRECHKFKGFTRFKELKNKVLYAEINPDNNILYLLSIHFKKRLSNEYWCIKDINRNIISIYNKEDFEIISGNNIEIFKNNLSSDEQNISDMWKDFYKIVGIKERKNERCRMNFMPKKYWKVLTEMEEENEKDSIWKRVTRENRRGN